MRTAPITPIAEDLDDAGRRLIYLLTITASLLLLLAERATEGEWEWFAPLPLRFAWYAFAISMPLSMALLWTPAVPRRALALAIGVIGVVTGLGAYTGTAYAPDLHLSRAPIFTTFTFSTLLAWFVVMPYLQGLRDSPRQLDYPTLFGRAWHDLLTLLIALAFTLICWLILWLSAGLFKLVGLDFLQQLLEEDAFSFPATGLMLGFGLTLSRAYFDAVRGGLRICLGFSQILLPAVSGITVLFAVALILSDLTPLWDTGHATFLLLSLIFLTIGLVNGVYADGLAYQPSPRGVRVIVIAGLLALPALAAIAAYAMGLRVGQYGLTVSRLYGMVAIGFALLYTLTYAATALRGLKSEPDWLPGLGGINRVLGALLVLVLVLSQSPGFNFRERALAYQLSQIEPGADSLGKTDWMYLRFELGTPGYRAVQRLAAEARSQQRNTLAAHLDRVLAATYRHNDGRLGFSLAQWLDEGRLRVLPEGTTVPPELAAEIAVMQQEIPMLSMPNVCAQAEPACLLIAVELNRTAPEEWVLVPPPDQGCEYPVFARSGDGWELSGYLRPDNYCINSENFDAVAAGRWSTRRPLFDDLATETDDATLLWHFQPR